MATPNGISSDCGASAAHPYNYQFPASSDESSGNSSHLSFLYDRAQGNTYTQSPSPAAATTQYSPSRYYGPEINNQQSNMSNDCTDTPSGEFQTNEVGHGLSRATPAPAYPYSPNKGLHSPGVPRNAESLACPTGSYAANQWSTSSQHQSVADRQRATTNPESQKGPKGLEQQMSKLSVSNGNQGDHPSTSPEMSDQPRSRLLRPEPSRGPPTNPARGFRTVDRNPQRVTGGAPEGYHNGPPASTTTLDPRKNYIRQNIPWKDINAARKFSVPILNRPRMQVTEFSLDDHVTSTAGQPRSPRVGEVDQSSVRHLLREGDEIGNYEQASIRYTGKTNPSKSFRLLQSVTGLSDSESIECHQNERKMRRRQKREEMMTASAAEGNDALKDADDVVDISYVGSKIPSRTFRSLQEAIGARDQQAGHAPSPSAYAFPDYGHAPFDEQPARSVKVIHLRPQKSLENLIGDF